MPTNYVGETYRIQTVSETDFDGNALTDQTVDHVQVQIYNADYTSLILDEEMTWDVTLEHWVYVWDTTGVAAGTYKAMVAIFFPDLSYSLEGPTRIRLKFDPRP
jgi:hypothetical protein